ncbi:MAG: RNA methyltransferase [Ruminococcaceae bacterium]|nr:RNA methyltransferase [Oscillospiraceae bacterium]
MMTEREIISSRQNREVVEVIKLGDKKARRDTGLFRIDGIKLAKEALEKGVKIEKIFLSESADIELPALPGSCRLIRTTDEVFEKISEEKSPEGIICVAKHLDNLVKIVTINNGDTVFSDGKRLFLAESVRDPGNLGTLIRSANALGCERMIISADCADLYNPKTLRAAMGAIFSIEIVAVESMSEAISALRANGRRIFAAALDRDARRLGSFELLPTDVFVVGNEGHGLANTTVGECTESVYIPMKAGAESLNAAAAAAVILWEQARNFI